MSETAVHTKLLRKGDTTILVRTPLRIRVERGPDRGQSIERSDDRLLVGTHEGCDVVLSDETVSRQHLEISAKPDGWTLRDLGSRNGTFIDDLRVGEVSITGKARIRVGESVLELAPAGRTEEHALPRATQFGDLLGVSAAMRQVFALLERTAATDATVLLTGESGTGKEVAARSIHQRSARASKPFVVVDCGALPDTLIESELYGHERGAFTGAARSREGAFTAADGGTIFLDEIGELPLAMQTRLLGVLERRTVQPLGSDRTRTVDVRVIAATNRDLRREVNAGTFRADLFFRLAVVNVHLPPLRERPEDIDLYVEAFLDEWQAQSVDVRIDAETIERLRRRPWRGNVRELRNTLESAVVLGTVPEAHESGDDAPPSSAGSQSVVAGTTSHAGAGTELIGARDEDLRALFDPAIPYKVAKNELISRFEDVYLRALMRAHNDNITRAARAAEIDRVYLLRLLDRYGMRPGRSAS